MNNSGQIAVFQMMEYYMAIELKELELYITSQTDPSNVTWDDQGP